MPVSTWQLCVCIIRWPQKTRPLYKTPASRWEQLGRHSKEYSARGKKPSTSCVNNIRLSSIIALIATVPTAPLQGLLWQDLPHSCCLSPRRRRERARPSKYTVVKNSTPFNGLINATRKHCYYCSSAWCTEDKREQWSLTSNKDLNSVKKVQIENN